MWSVDVYIPDNRVIELFTASMYEQKFRTEPLQLCYAYLFLQINDFERKQILAEIFDFILLKFL